MTTKKTSKPTTTLQPFIICTSHKGVFFGHADPSKLDGDSIRLADARNCIAWSASIGGVLGLASVGPNRDCRIGAVAPAVTLRGITAVMEVSTAAAKAWTEAPCVS